MSKKITLLLLVILLLLACTCSLPAIPLAAVPTPTVAASAIPTLPEPAAPPIPTRMAIPTAGPSAVPSDLAFIVVRLHPSDGLLGDQLAAGAQKALQLGLKPFVEYDAEW